MKHFTIGDIQELQSELQMGVWSFDVYSLKFNWSKEVLKILGDPDISRMTALENQKEILQAIQLCIQKKQPFNLELSINEISEKKLIVRILGKPILEDNSVTQIVGLICDITLQTLTALSLEAKTKELEQHTKRLDLEDRLRFVLSVAKMGIFEWDLKSNILSWDKNMFELYGIDEKDFTGRVEDWSRSLFPENAKEAQKKLDESINSGKFFSTQFKIRTPSGQIRNIGARGYIERDPNDKPIRMVGVNWDETLEYQQQQTIENQRVKMIEASRLSTLGEMAGGLAHEINNPLTIILVMIQQLRKTAEKQSLTTEELEVKLSKIEKTADRIVRIVKNLKYFARDGSEDPFHSCELKTIVQETLELSLEKFKNSAVDLRMGPIPDININCRGVQISQVLLNLLNNAFDAVQKSNEKTISLDFQIADSFVEITVSDTGPGIPDNILDKIFNPFFTTKEIGKGTGLGLSLSKGIMDSHHGRLSFIPDRKLTTFMMEIPLS